MVSLPLLEDAKPESGGGCGSCEANGGSDERCGNGLEKIYHTTAVRYGFLKHIGEFSHPEGMAFSCGAQVVVQTNRGIEIGEQVSLTCGGCNKSVDTDRIRTYIENSGPESYQLDNGRILREATPDDLVESRRLYDRASEMKRAAQQEARNSNLEMKVVECEYLFGGDRAIFYFTAEGRVDFRGLVKTLSHDLQTRIKMHQVGARDEARLLADFETCGQEVCCKKFLKSLKPVTMRMAKLQRATLDPTKVSGRCGRLKCCLRYEHEGYEELDAKLPRKGEKIKLVDGYGTVVDRQILTQLLRVARPEGGGVVAVVNEDVVERKLKEFPPEAERLAEMRVRAEQASKEAEAERQARRAERGAAEGKSRRGRKGDGSESGVVGDAEGIAQSGGESVDNTERRPGKRRSGTPNRRRGGRRRAGGQSGEQTGGQSGGQTGEKAGDRSRDQNSPPGVDRAGDAGETGRSGDSESPKGAGGAESEGRSGESKKGDRPKRRRRSRHRGRGGPNEGGLGGGGSGDSGSGGGGSGGGGGSSDPTC